MLISLDVQLLQVRTVADAKEAYTVDIVRGSGGGCRWLPASGHVWKHFI
jgi:hypothetical protein